MASRKSASDLAEQIGSLAEQLQERATHEVRTYLGKEIERVYVRRGANNDGDLDKAVLAMIDAPDMKEVKAQLVKSIDEFGDIVVSDDFRAGILFASRLVQDLEYDY